MDWQIFLYVFIAGVLGGLVQGLISKQIIMPHYDSECKTLFPGTLGGMIVGGVAAVAFAGLYGSLRSFEIISVTGVSNDYEASLPVSELVGSLLIGLSGGRWLTVEADRWCYGNGGNARTETP